MTRSLVHLITATFVLGGVALGIAEVGSNREPKKADRTWWSLQPIVRPTPPQAEADNKWARNAIDAFILARLSENGLGPNPEADRRTLIRRLSYDLTGLPPTPEEIGAFLADDSPDAYGKVVDRLLASEHYGERWARHWLDVVRFGESHGFEYNQPRQNSWHYRNWVVSALNRDMPYDEFVRWQLAGDTMAKGDPDGVVATGFLVAGPHNTTLPSSDPMKKTMRQDEMEDLIATVGQSFLGMTINCARCHDHKFDPVTQKDYYKVAAALGGVNHGERKIQWNGPDVQAEIAKIKIEREAAEKHLGELFEPARRAILAEREADPGKRPPAPEALEYWDFTKGLRGGKGSLDIKLHNGATQDGGGLHLDGKLAYAESAPLGVDLSEKTLEVWVKLDGLGQRGGGAISVQTRGGSNFDAIVFGEREPGRWMAGSDVFKRTKPFQGPEEKDAGGRPVHFAIVYGKDGTITGYRDGLPYGQPYKSVGIQPFKAGESQVIFGLRHGPANAGRMLKGTVTRAKIYGRALAPEEVAASAGAASNYVSDEEIAAKLTDAQKGEGEKLREALAALRSRMEKLEGMNKPVSVYACVSKNPGATHVLNRGSVLQPGEEVAAGGISAIAGSDFGLAKNAPDPERREKLAAWITDPANPLFGRVIANRLWHFHFGNGIVATPNDFGFGGVRPTHPELLDWLAAEFKEQRWSMKAMHRLIVNSATYRQSAVANSKASAVDAGNRFLWRMAPRRLEGEELRDSLLSISGGLNREIGGQGYRDMREYKFKGSHFYDPIPQVNPDQFRRTLYRFSPRGARRTMLDTFDCPDPSAITPNRAATTTPLQSLSLMNNAFVLSLAERFAERLKKAGGEVDAQIGLAYELSYSREAEADETDKARKFIGDHGLAAFCRVVFNSNEFLYVR